MIKLSVPPTVLRHLMTRWCELVLGLASRQAANTDGHTAIEYALTLGGIALSATGVTAAIGGEVSMLFDAIGLEFCQQVYGVCAAR
jgi:Flp pilus assembly pilin Flp